MAASPLSCQGGASGHARLKRVSALKGLEQAEVSGYLACGEWQGKAGGYAIKGVLPHLSQISVVRIRMSLVFRCMRQRPCCASIG